MPVPLLDLRAQHETIRDEISQAISGIVESQLFILGAPVERLEREVAALSHTKYAVGCASGTDALLLALRALDVGPGDEVITTPFTFFATAGTIHNAGGRPVFADIDPDTFNILPEAAAAARTSRTKAVMPVDLFGQMAPIERVMTAMRGVPVIEDAAQTIGARRSIDGEWRMAGEVATIGTFSFFPSKNLGAFGDGGMMVTQDEAIASRLKRLRMHGGAKMYFHDEVGFNSRLDALQAAILSAKLPHLEAWSAKRRSNAAYYDEALRGVDGVVTPVVDPGQRVDLQPVHDSRRPPRSASELPQGARHRQRDLLPAAAPPATVLRVPRLQERRVPGVGTRRERGAVAADLSRADARAAGRGRRHYPRILWPLSRPRRTVF